MNRKDNTAEITMTLTPFMEKVVKENFNCEIEMLQGSVSVLDDGRKEFKFEMDADKAEPIRKFIMAIIIKEKSMILN